MKTNGTWVLAAALSVGLLVGCMTPAEEEAYYREICTFDGNSFDEIVPGTEAFEYCLELERSGLGQEDNPDSGSIVRFRFFH